MTREDSIDIDKHETKLKSHQESYEKAYIIVRNFLGKSPMSDVRHIIDDRSIDFRQKSRRIVQHLRDTHGILSSHQKSQIDADIQALPSS